MNKDELRALMVKYHDTQKTLADAMGIALSTLNAKINGTNGAEFSQTEIEFIAGRYDMDDRSVVVVFFPRLVSKKDTQ